MRVAAVPNSFDAPGMYRCMFQMGELAKRGHDCFVWPHTIRDLTNIPDPERKVDFWIEYDMNEDPGDYDVMVLLSRMEPFWRFWKKPFVYDLDDWYQDLPDWNPAKRGTDKETGRSDRDMQPHIAEKAAVMTVSTPFLAEATGWNPNTVVIRNRLHWPMWEEAELQYEVDRGDEIRVGWMGNPDWRLGDIRVMQGFIHKIMKLYPNVVFVSGGHAETHNMLSIPRNRRVTLPHLSFFKEHLRLSSLIKFDIGLVPLAPIPFNEAKSHLKGMEYNACGVPYVASNTESYRHYTREGENGFVARSVKEWASRLVELIEDEELRREMGRKARLVAAENKIEDHIVEWESAWSGVLA